MSGRKYSRVELQKNVREVLQCKLSAEKALAQTRSWVKALNEAAQKTEALQPLAEAAEKTMQQLEKTLAQIKADETQMMRMTLDQVQQIKRTIYSLQRQLEKTIADCKKAGVAAAQRTEVAALLHQLQQNQRDWQIWAKQDCLQLMATVASLLKQIDEQIAKTGQIGAPQQQDIQQEEANLQRLLDKISTRKEENEQRQYIASAVEKACAKMGFSTERKDPADPLQDLVIKVNTYAYGYINFRLELAGAIRSETEMNNESCCINFAQLEQHLTSLGVKSEFRMTDNDQPIRINKTEAELPDSNPSIEISNKS